MGLISFVEEKYCKNFEQYFMSSKRLTEFFLYYSYLVYSGDINKYVFASVPRFNYLGRVDPKTVDYNTPASKKLLLDQFPSISVFGLHRGFIEFLNDELKLQLFDLYQKFFNDDKVKQILIDIFDSTELEYYFYDQIPIDFSADIYKSKNPDLSHLTDKKAMLHYLHQGINEGRIYK
jgi:hypothetical protein